MVTQTQPYSKAVEYFDRFPSDLSKYPLTDAHLQAELRAATALAWTHPFPAASMCAYVVMWTANDAAERIEVVEAFDREFERFTDKEASLEDQLAAWDVMLQKAKGERDAMSQRRDRALDRYDSASEVAKSCCSKFEGLKDAKAAFDEEIREWKEEQMWNVFFGLFTACESIGSLSAGLEALVGAAKGFLDDGTSLPSTGSVAGSSSGDANSMAIFTLAQHAVNSKTLAQALANTVKIGQEYVRRQIDLTVLEQDVEKLQQLQEDYHYEAQVYEEGMQRFYDWMMTLKVGVWMAMKKAAKFTLAPTTTKAEPQIKANSQGLPADFHDGFHWRMWGMDPILRGAVPRPDKLVNGHVVVNLWITTEGKFSDIDEKGAIHYLSARPQSKLHMVHTPFTQWTVKIERESRGVLNLDALKGLDVHWVGNYMPVKPPRRDSALAL
ncbi:hypothetical protein N657DRAFT_684009 [Parathielavia appendiculata]|uniref:Uncharacterized protein n=1 Tax=Parathielavia appendiculata TaxID=2587402 RepID=A0AAN6Z0Z9_9PEZI|nr:hypothetical protein N657DRAFT_684009 [Parathielavia appendiculata]